MSDTVVERRIVRCPEHGLAYNAAAEDGCARCRRAPGAAAAGGVAPAAPPRAHAGDGAGAGAGGQLLLAVILVGAAGFGFSTLHRDLVTSLAPGASQAKQEVDPVAFAGEDQALLMWIDDLATEDTIQEQAAHDPELAAELARVEDPAEREQLRRHPSELRRIHEDLQRRLDEGAGRPERSP